MSKIKFMIYKSDWNIIYRPDKRAKKYQLAGIGLPINDSTKSPQTKILSQFRYMLQICCAIYKPYSYNLLVSQ